MFVKGATESWKEQIILFLFIKGYFDCSTTMLTKVTCDEKLLLTTNTAWTLSVSFVGSSSLYETPIRSIHLLLS